MYNVSEISNVIKKMAKNKSVTMKQLLNDCDINKGFIYDLEHKNTYPSCDKLSRIADYLDCSVDYLLGRTDEQTTTYHANNVSSSFVQNDSAVTLGPVSVTSAFHNNSSDISSSKEETEILNIYRSLNARDRTKLMNLVFDIQDQATKA